MTQVIDRPAGPVAEIPADVLVWIRRLSDQLELHQPSLTRFNAYYDGIHDIAYASDKWRREFMAVFTNFRDNWIELVVDAVEERLNVVGFRGFDAGKRRVQAMDIWQDNGMDAASRIATTESLIYGRSFVSVWPDDDGDARISIESPSQVIVAHSSADRRKRLAGWKRWVDDSEYVFATLYLPDFVYKVRSKVKSRINWAQNELYFGPQDWERRIEPGEPWPLPNPLGVVPIVPLINKPKLSLGGLSPILGKSEIANVIPVQDAINKVIMDMLIAADFAGYRQRWVTGFDIPEDPETHQPVEPFKSAVDRLWIAESADTKFGDFEPTDLSNYVKVIELLVQHVASQTRTPPHYFYLTGQFPSGDALKSAEAGLVAKARAKMLHLGEAWEEVMRLCFACIGDPRQDAQNAETVWTDPESRSDAQLADAVVKQGTAGVPWEQRMVKLGYSPQEIERMRAQRAADQLVALPLAPLPVLPPTPAGELADGEQL